jgi:soluble lytic murein transglycosylase-like protein
MNPSAAQAARSFMRSFTSLLILAGAVALAGLGPAAGSARADHIALITDSQGHKVYVNSSDPAPASRRSLPGTPAATPPPAINRLVNHAAQRFRVDPRLVRAIIQVESDYNPNAVSSKGAMGLMQLIPATAERFGVNNPFNPGQNIEGGVNYLKYLLNLFKGDVNLSLAAYNAGEHSVLRQGGVPDIAETVNYVRKVRSLYDGPGETGPETGFSRQGSPHVTIYRYVDASGVVHFTDGSDL